MTRTRSARRLARLQLEHLEDRAVPATFTVNTTLDDVTPANGKFSLREAITKANATTGADTIVLPAGVFKITQVGAGEDGNATGDFDITGGVTIQGAGAGLTVINGQQLDRVFDVFGSGPSSIKVVLQAATIRNGVVTGPGAGISVVNADLVVRDSVITDNQASGFGGGISNSDFPGTGNVKVIRTIVARNSAGRSGGGLSIASSKTNSSLLTLQDSTIRRNLASVVGGGISTTTVNLTNCTVSGNVALIDISGIGGGGILADTATLTNCTVSGNSAPASNGGGINATTAATLTGCTINGNSADQGGGIEAPTTTLTNCTVSGNSAGGNGGGIGASTAKLTNCVVSGNSSDGDGGGIEAGLATLTNCTVSGNTTSSRGGGIQADTMTSINCTISRNTASFHGGASGTGGGIFAFTIATLTNCTVSGNSAALDGGGIFAGGGFNLGTANLTNCTISANSAAADGGGINADAATLTNCTIAENFAHTGGGLLHNPGGGAFSLKNTIVALNLIDFGGSGPDVAGLESFTTAGHNLIGNNSGSTGFTDDVNGDIVGSAATPIDPKLAPLANNGGKTKTHALLAGSRAIDAGDNSSAPATDQRGFGFPRKKDGNGDGTAVVDIGAFEK